MMKKASYFLLGMFLLAACGDDSENLIGGNSRIMLDLGTDISYGKQTKAADTRALDLTAYQNVNNYTVQLIKDGTVLETNTYGAMELTKDIEPGTYTFKAFYGTDENAAWDKLYVEGSQTFTVESGRTETVQFTCVPANAKIKVVYSNDFTTYYSDCTVSVTTKYQPTPFTITKADAEADKEAYFKVDAGKNTFTLNFDLKDKEGNSVTPANFGAKTVEVSPRDFLTLTIKPNLIDIEGGKINGVTVTVDNSLTEAPVNVTIPDNYVTE